MRIQRLQWRALAQGHLVINPRNCSKILGNHIGYEIWDGEDNRILKVESRYIVQHQMLTNVEGTFYGKDGRKIISTDMRGLRPHMNSVGVCIGLTPAGFLNLGIVTQEESVIAAACAVSGGSAHELISQDIEGKLIKLDGKIVGATLRNCDIIMERGEWVMLPKGRITESRFNFVGPAGILHQVFKSLGNQPPIGEAGTKCEVAGKYKSHGCEHVTTKPFSVGDQFPSCHHCAVAVKWIPVPF